MTLKEFRYAMERGLGRCIPALMEEPERYRALVLQAVRRTYAFDAQCEGTRSAYVYRMIRCYPDTGPFLACALAAFRKQKADGGWNLLFLAELLRYFADDGEAEAELALREKHAALHAALLHRRRLPRRGFFPERDAYEQLCLCLDGSYADYRRIAEAAGELYLAKPALYRGCFDWLYAKHDRGDNARIKRLKRKSAALAAYLDAHTEEALPPESAPERREERRLAREQAREAARQAYLTAGDPDTRAAALSARAFRPRPEDAAALMQDAESPVPQLRQAALAALGEVRAVGADPTPLALRCMEVEPLCAGLILARNYTPAHEAALTAVMVRLETDPEDASGWHHLHGAVLDLFDGPDRVEEPPVALLRGIWESTRCSLCRESAFRHMARRRRLTPEMLREAQHDCNDDVRALAARYAKKSGTKSGRTA